jgi:hypothetical protein
MSVLRRATSGSSRTRFGQGRNGSISSSTFYTTPRASQLDRHHLSPSVAVEGERSIRIYLRPVRAGLGPSTSESYLQSDPNGRVSPGPQDRQILQREAFQSASGFSGMARIHGRAPSAAVQCAGGGGGGPCQAFRRARPTPESSRRPAGDSYQRASAQGASSRAGRLHRPCHRDTGGGRRRDTGMSHPWPRAAPPLGSPVSPGKEGAGRAAKAPARNAAEYHSAAGQVPPILPR